MTRRTKLARARVLPLVAAMAMLIACLAPSARGDSDALLADLVDYPDVRRVIPSDTHTLLERCVPLSPDQSRAAADLISAARNELTKAVNRHMRFVRDDPTFEQMRASDGDVLKKAGAIEAGLREDLRLLIVPDELTARAAAEDALSRFQRALRSTLMRGRTELLLRADPRAFVEAQRVSVEAGGPLEALLAEYESALDAAIVRERRGTMSYFSSIRSDNETGPDAEQRKRKIQNEFLASKFDLRRVQAKMISRFLPLLPPEAADRFVLNAMRDIAEGFDARITEPERFSVIREVLALDLTPKQRAEVTDFVRGANEEMLALARACIRDTAAYELMDNAARSKSPTAPTNIFCERASKLRARVSADVLAVLTPEQRSTYDASPVLDPSESSRVNDVP